MSAKETSGGEPISMRIVHALEQKYVSYPWDRNWGPNVLTNIYGTLFYAVQKGICSILQRYTRDTR